MRAFFHLKIILANGVKFECYNWPIFTEKLQFGHNLLSLSWFDVKAEHTQNIHHSH